ncbi:MAG: homoserine dehydrogenase [Mucilaginibacter polytrichastri]|nr:homoserine dehydrogenase [Mucilaginibacter polytrichastri]
MSKNITIGMFGFGVVGHGLVDIIQSKTFNLSIKKIVIKHPEKKRTLPAELFTTDARAVLDDPEINTVVELINDADAAFSIVKEALQKGKNVVSANKKMIAEHLEELVELQHEHGASLLYEGAVCGSIPIIRNLEEYYDNELLYEVSGIFNGSSNYILSKVFNDNLSYAAALKEAQDLGFAETDPTLDVGGFDPKYKLAIAAAHAYGTFIRPQEILNIGIDTLSAHDLQYAREKGWKIKLVPTVRKIDDEQIALYVLPRFVKPGDLLYQVENEFNGVIVQAAFAERQFFYGKGAGGHPTGAAVLSDIMALRYDYHYEYKKALQTSKVQFSNEPVLDVYLRYSDENLPSEIGFLSVNEQFSSPTHKYLTGTVHLKNLIAARDRILSARAFIAATPRSVATHVPDAVLDELTGFSG